MRKGWGRLFLYEMVRAKGRKLGCHSFQLCELFLWPCINWAVLSHKQLSQRMTIFFSPANEQQGGGWTPTSQMNSNDIYVICTSCFFLQFFPSFLTSLPLSWYSFLLHSSPSPRWTKEDFASPLMLLDWKGWETLRVHLRFNHSLTSVWF